MDVLNFSHSVLLSSETGQFGLNTNILETNLVNQLILVGGLIFLLRDSLSTSLSERNSEILANVQNSEQRLVDAKKRLEEAKKQLTQAQAIIDEIKRETLLTQKATLENNYQQTKNDIIRKISSATATLKNRERLILSEIKNQISLLAIEQVVDTLSSHNGREKEQMNYMKNRIQMISSPDNLTVN